MKKVIQNLFRPSSPALRNADGRNSGQDTPAVSPAQSFISQQVQPEGVTIQTLKITVSRASDIPLPKISVMRKRHFYIILTDGITTHKTSSRKPNANNNTVTWNERIADFRLYSITSDIMLHLFVEERFGEDTLVGDCSFSSSIAAVTPVEITRELRNVNGEVLQHTAALPSIHFEIYMTSNVGQLDGASTISEDEAGSPFSGADGAIMAEAFRKMLRKPDFPVEGVEEEGDRYSDKEETSGGHGNGSRKGTEDMTGAIGSLTRAGHEVLPRELVADGRDITSVASLRGVRVEHGYSL